MERYMLIKEVGSGTFGTVWQAISHQDKEVVAIKIMKKKYYSWYECLNLREVKSLRKLKHPNITKLKEIIRENDVLYFVFEYMDCSLYQLMEKNGRPFSEDEIRKWCFQLFQALAYMHHCDYFHRDLKPENLLVSNGIIKIADFGQAREISSNPPFTDYVSTRWYRAPEVLLKSCAYGSAVDMWAMGAIMAELFTLRPLFPGSSQADQIYKICKILGTTEEMKFVQASMFWFPKFDGVPLSKLIPTASEAAIGLITLLCSWDPSKRPTASQALQHPFFEPCFYVPPSLCLKRVACSSSALGAKREEAFNQRFSRRYPRGFVPDTKPTPYVAPSQNTGHVDAQWISKMNRQVDEIIGTKPKLVSYQQPQQHKQGFYTDSPSDLADKMANLALLNSSIWTPKATDTLLDIRLNPNKQPLRQSRAMRASGWPNDSTDFLAQLHGMAPPGSYYHRKILG